MHAAELADGGASGAPLHLAPAPAAPVIDVVIPARNEAPTVAAVVRAALACTFARDVIVVDDGSDDATAELAAAAGARVVRRPPAAAGSKAHAMEAGVDASDADAFLFVDADCVGLDGRHLDDICRPFVDGRADMSIGWFDYGVWNPLVNHLAPTTGERVLPRWVWEAIPPEHREGYTIEYRINQVIAEGRLRTVSRTMPGVTHRTKRDKYGKIRGVAETVRMFLQLVALPVRGAVRVRAYWYYHRGLTIERSVR